MFPRVNLKKSSKCFLVLATTTLSISQAHAQEITGRPAIPSIVTDSDEPGGSAVSSLPPIVTDSEGLPKSESDSGSLSSTGSSKSLTSSGAPGSLNSSGTLGSLSSAGSTGSLNSSTPTDSSIADLERKYFEHDFHSDSTMDRLSRLEELIFGAETKGSIAERVANLEEAANKRQIEISNSPNPKRPLGGRETFDSAMSSGIANYKMARYHHAQEDFEKAIKLNPQSPEAYANLGGVFLMVRDKENAKEAFRACFGLHPFGKIGSYAKEKILKLAEEEAYAKTNPQDSQRTVNRTVALIDRQSAERARAYQDEAARVAQYRIDLTNYEIQKLTADPFYGITRNHRYNNGYGRDVSDWNYIKSNYLRTDGMVQANLALTDGNKKATSVIDSGANLKDQLLQAKSSPDGARLRALGTSLYARYYGDGLPSVVDPPMNDPAPPALQATALGINRK